MKKFIIALVLTYFMAVLPAMGALTVDNWVNVSLGNKKMRIAQVDFDSSYAYGGESFDYTAYGFLNVDSVKITGQNGYTFDYDYTNKKIKAFTVAPPIVFDERVYISSNSGTLKYPAAYIMYVSANGTPLKVIPGGLTPVTGTVSVSEPVWGTRNTLTLFANDGNHDHVMVTYVTQAWKEVFDNYVLAYITDGSRVAGHASLTFTAGTPDVLDLGEQAIAIQSITWNDDGTYKVINPINKGETAVSQEAAVDFTHPDLTSAETRLSFLQTDAVDDTGDTVYVQYIKKPASGASATGNTFLVDRFMEEYAIPASGTTASLASGPSATAAKLNENMLLFGTGGAIPGPSGFYINLISASESPSGANEAILSTYSTAPNIFSFGQQRAADAAYLKPSFIYGLQSEIPNLVDLEVVNGADLADITNVRVEIIGN